MTTAAPSTQPLMSERKVSLIGAALSAIGPVSLAVYTPAMPEIVEAFNAPEAAVQMSLTLYFAGFAFAQLVCGPVSDGLGRRPVTIAFMLIYTAASLVALFAPNIEVLIAARFAQGIGAAAGISMSRAIVRDLFAGEQAARIMNLIGIMLALGPATAPTIGGLTMMFFGWHAIFLVMAAAGLAIAATTLFVMKETVERDPSRIRPRALIRSYGSLLTNRYFLSASLCNACSVGAVYSLATVLPFILIARLGLTPTQFGLAMLIQSLNFLAGSLTLRRLMGRYGAFRLVKVGVVLIAIASVMIAVLLRVAEPSLLSVMGPVGVYAFGVGFVIPGMTTAAMAPFPNNAGAAAALTGFVQLGIGLLGGTLMAMIGDPVAGISTVLPALGMVCVVSWIVWKNLPEPPLKAVRPVPRTLDQ